VHVGQFNSTFKMRENYVGANFSISIVRYCCLSFSFIKRYRPFDSLM